MEYKTNGQLSSQQTQAKVVAIIKSLQNYWGVDIPLKRLDIVALPSFSSVKPIDNLGLIIFR